MLKEIQRTLREHSGKEGRAATSKFVPCASKVYGVRMPVINELSKKYKHGGFELVEKLWRSGAFEERLLSAKILGKISNKNPAKTLEFIKRVSKDISDWAVCDTIGTQSIKPIVRTHSNEIFLLSNQLIHSKNFWQRRLAIVLVEWYTRDPSFRRQIRALLSKVKNDDEYYVRKAVTWINRNFRVKC